MMRRLSLLVALASVGCESKSSGSRMLPDTLGVLEGAQSFGGPYPAPGDVSFTTRDFRYVTVRAFPGQVLVFFAAETLSSDAESVVTAAGGSLLAKIPKLGSYLAGVPTGGEGSFIGSMRSDWRVQDAMPNVAIALRQDGVVVNPEYFESPRPVPLNVPPGAVVIDSEFYPGGHGEDVAFTIENNGGVVGARVNLEIQCVDCADLSSADHAGLILAAAAQGNSLFNPGQPLVANMSFGPEVPDDPPPADINAARAQNVVDNEVFLRSLLGHAASMPPELRDQLAVTFALGNSSVDLSSVMSSLRADSALSGVLSQNFFLVGSQNFAGSNTVSSGDPNVFVASNAEAAFGTSFAAPYMAALIQRLMRELGVSFAIAREALRRWVDFDADGVVDWEETAAAAAQIASACGDAYCALDEVGICPADCGYCGDGACDEHESPASCPADCAVDPVCGDGLCGAGESSSSCPIDCGGSSASCGDGLCDSRAGEATDTCPGDCPNYCGDGFCNVGTGEPSSCPGDCQDNACCVDNGGCPSETPYECPGSCCCCGYGQVCQSTSAGWSCAGG